MYIDKVLDNHHISSTSHSGPKILNKYDLNTTDIINTKVLLPTNNYIEQIKYSTNNSVVTRHNHSTTKNI